MIDLAALLRSDATQADAIAAALDAATHEARVAAARTLPRTLFWALYERCRGQSALTLDQLVELGRPALRPIDHVGTNNMPLFRAFSKMMYRQPNGGVAGYNQQPWAWLTGPGYFTVEPTDDPARGDLVVNYLKLPEVAPPGWPRIYDNGRGFSHFVYRGMKDYLRRVSAHVVVGHAVRNGEDQPQIFILVRAPD